MIINIDNKAKEKIYNWDKVIYKQFPFIIDLISIDFFNKDIDVNIVDDNKNSIKVSNRNDKDIYISYEYNSDIFPSMLNVYDNNKSIGYEVLEDNDNLNLVLRNISKKLNNDDIIEINILGYGISIKIYSNNNMVINELRGNKIDIDYYKLLSSNNMDIKNLDNILECVKGNINEIFVYKYNKNILKSRQVYEYDKERNKVLVRK